MAVLNVVWCCARHYASAPGEGPGFATTLALGSRGALAWVLLFPTVAGTSHLLMRARLPGPVRVLVHALLALALATLKALLIGVLQRLGGPRVDAPLLALVGARIYSDLLHYAVMVGICHALCHHARAQAHTARAARLEAQLTAARLGALRLRLQPTWLLGSLAALEPMVRQSPAQAEQQVAALADRLRALLARPRERTS
jgi:hypothetical protein